ncbi:Hpt domain-containing protein [Thiococcus pfennigii]|uniref:Hpt domain-containing protein n=1 Tax=Thiococcus pfennigii TaxID=1057 RepID=UPI001903563C|nr:Hpt domain-containing protein [Thiococcus pfennigii]MBK1702293.1 hypothetical protein [Thiococcus pfennigii]MBK1733423.1 hypothetical protein [Thiococcus pfennigii]
MTAKDLEQGAEWVVRDEAMALSAVGGDADLASELYAILCAELPADLAELRAHGAAADWTGLAETAHRVCGASRYCGVPALDQALAGLEHLARGGDDPEAIRTALERVAAEIRRLVPTAC